MVWNVRLRQTFVFATLLLVSLSFKVMSQTPQQHRELLNSLDLSDRESELSISITWDQNELIPGCRKNFQPDIKCDGITYQYISGPEHRSDKTYQTNVSFLSHQLVNLLSNATFVSRWSHVHEYCGENEIKKLANWVSASKEINQDEHIFLSYLAPDDPWFVCFHRDRRDAAAELKAFGQLNDRFNLEYREFWMWHKGRIIGEVQCGTTYRRRSNAPSFPQCSFDLNFGEGDFRMSVGPFPATNIRRVLSDLARITRNFWEISMPDTQSHGIEEDLFYRPLVFDFQSEVNIEQIENETR